MRLRKISKRVWVAVAVSGLLAVLALAYEERGQTSYMKVDITESFASLFARFSAANPAVEQEQSELLNER
jgi:hypothetical protein